MKEEIETFSKEEQNILKKININNEILEKIFTKNKEIKDE